MRTVRKNLILNQSSGQGTIEYILVLFVSILIVLGGVYQVNDAFRNWASNYFGEYLACLLETGELPSLGGSAGASAICDESFEPFTFAAGRPLIGDPIGAGSGSGPGSGDSGDSGSNNNQAGGDTAPSGAAASTGPSGRRGSRFASRRGGGSRGAGFNRNGQGGSPSDSGGDGVLSVNGAESRRTAKTIPVRRASSINYGRGSSRKESEDDEKRTKTTAFEKEKVQRKRLVKVAASMKSQEEVPEIEGYTFGNFLRYLIIAAILIALLLLLAGQGLQINKSLEGN